MGKCLLLLAHVFLVWRAVAGVEMPEIKSDLKCGVALLLSVRNTVPWLLEEGAEYDIDFFAFLEQNRIAVEHISQHVAFRRLASKKAPRITIDISVQDSNSKSKRVEKLRMVEVTPLLGAFRGIAGGDCASQYCFAFSYLPMERTFYLYDADDDLLGYAALSEVDSQGESGGAQASWYLHDITGRRLSVRLADIFIHALSKIAKESGKPFLLPTAEMIYEVNNHAPLIELQKGMVWGREQTPLTYHDAEVRDSLDQAVPNLVMTYDTSAANAFAVRPKLSKTLLSQISTSLSKGKAFAFTDEVEQLPKQSALLLALDMLTSERLDVAKRQLQDDIQEIANGGINVNAVNYAMRRKAAQQIAGLGGIPYKTVAALSELLANRAAVPLQEYYDGIAAAFAEQGIQSIDEILESRAYFFYEGHLRSPDRLTTSDSKLRKQTVDFAVKLMRRWPNPVLAYSVLLEAPDILEKSGKMQNAVKYFLRRPEENQVKLQVLRAHGLKFSFLDDEETKILKSVAP